MSNESELRMVSLWKAFTGMLESVPEAQRESVLREVILHLASRIQPVQEPKATMHAR